MWICETIGTRRSLQLTIIHQDSTYHCFYPLNLRQSPSIIQIWRIQLHTRIPHVFCLTTTAIPRVLVKQWAPEKRSHSLLYTRVRPFTAFMLSTSAKVPQSYRYPKLYSTHVLHTYSVWQPLPSHVYWWSNRHPRIAQIHGYTHGLDMSLLVASQLAPNSCNDRDMPE
jgi:hypothetical protein